MGIKVTIPNTSSDTLTFGSANTTTAAQIAGIDSGSSNGQLAFYTTASGTSTERVRVNASGNVGIGTASPQAKLQVAGDIVTNISQAFNWNMYYSGGDKYIANGYAFQTYFDGSGNWRLLNAPSNSSGAGAAATLTERLRIDSSGNLLVGGTTQPIGTCRLVVQNSGSSNNGAGFFFTSTDDRGNVLVQHAGATGATSRKQISFFNAAGSEIGFISSTGSATTYSTSSDYRLKENIQPMTGALATVTQLNPVTYTWKDGGFSGQGFIAHELQAVVPDAVVGEKDALDADGNPKYQGIDTSFLVATLTAAIQEQQAIIQTLTDRITALEQA